MTEDFTYSIIICAHIDLEYIPKAMASGVFAFVMIIGFWFARTGNMMAIFRDVGSFGDVVIREDTGQRVQGTPCFGICFGIMTIFVALLFAGQFEDSLGYVVTAPAMLAGVFAILAGIVFVLDYKGSYTRQDF